ncbi:MAG: hypothetical protein IT423_22600 [Pirellulaceae bacterium]|nr:hypothetical protein [Pirellulaceae bacterium]
MRARNRRSVTNTISAAILEITIMGLFVIIAQPQLRDALFEILHPASEPQLSSTSLSNSTAANSTASNLRGTGAPSGRASSGAVESTGVESTGVEPAHAIRSEGAHVIDLTLQAITRDPQDQTFNQNLANFASYVSGLAAHGRPTPPTTQQPTTQPGALPSTSPMPSTSPTAVTPSAWPSQPELITAGYAPLEQYESFSVAVPSVPSLPSTSSLPSHPAGSTYGQPTNQVTGATQLLPNQWNIASAAQSPRPISGWVPIPAPAPSNNVPLYPPPYGTQNQWK